MRGSQFKSRAGEGFEAPMSTKSSLRFRVQLAGSQRFGVNGESAKSRVWFGRKIHAGAGLALDVKNKVVRDIRGEGEWSPLDGQNQRRFLQAEHGLGIHRPQRRQ